MAPSGAEDVSMAEAPSHQEMAPPVINIIPAPSESRSGSDSYHDILVSSRGLFVPLQDESSLLSPGWLCPDGYDSESGILSSRKSSGHPRSYSDPYGEPLSMRAPATSLSALERNRRSATVPSRDYILDPADPRKLDTAASGSSRIQGRPAVFQCTLCPKRFTRGYNLRSHLRTHTDERPFVCTVCGKAFALQHDRKRHEGLHSGEKKFVCKGDLAKGFQWGCGRRFARADALGRHLRSEAGRLCIQPLVDEESAGYSSNKSSGLPLALLAQYPALANVDWDALPDYYGDEVLENNVKPDSGQLRYVDDMEYQMPSNGQMEILPGNPVEPDRAQTEGVPDGGQSESPTIDNNFQQKQESTSGLTDQLMVADSSISPQTASHENSGEAGSDVSQTIQSHIASIRSSAEESTQRGPEESQEPTTSGIESRTIATAIEGQPHLFIAKSYVPLLDSVISRLKTHFALFNWRQIRADETGYFIIFEDSVGGREECQRCYQICHRGSFMTHPLYMQCLLFEDRQALETHTHHPGAVPTDASGPRSGIKEVTKVSNSSTERGPGTGLELKPQETDEVRGFSLAANEMSQNQQTQDKTVASRAAPSDSGYHSGIGTDTESVCSIDSIGSSLGLPHDFLQDFIAFFGDSLITETHVWAKFALAHHSPGFIEHQLRALLKDYALDLSSGQGALSHDEPKRQSDLLNDSMAVGATRLVRRYRPKIARYFRDHAISSSLTSELLFSRLQELSKQLSLTERMGLLDKVTVSPNDVDGADQCDDDDEDNEIEDENITDLDSIRDFLVSGKEFQNLSAALRRSLYFDDQSGMRRVRDRILEQLHEQTGSERKSVYSICFDVAWNVEEFLKSQFEEKAPDIGSLVALTGSALYAQATTCSKYLEMTWPRSGSLFLWALETVISAPSGSSGHHTVTAGPDLAYTITNLGKKIFVEARGSAELLIELAQQLAWIGSALRSSPFGEELAYCQADVQIRPNSSFFSMAFRSEPLHPTEQSCWFPLFCGASIARDFPIPAREGEPGLEVPLEILAGITGARHAAEFNGGVVVKGFSSMLVPTKRRSSVVQWHLVSSPDCETRLSYQDAIDRCPNRATIEEVDLNCLRETRAIVGWCSAATSFLGSDCANYENIGFSGAEEVDSNTRIKFSGATIGFQQFGVGQLDFALGAKEGKCHFQRSGPYKRIINAAEKTRIVLYDTSEKRAWLVPACEVMLHMVHHRNWMEPFESKGDQVKLLVTGTDKLSAKEILLRSAAIVLDECDSYKFGDMILDLWSTFERLIAENVQRDRLPGATLAARPRDTIQGFEFKAIVEERSPFRRKQVAIEKTSGGWPALIQDIDALVLFAKGYEDIIRPVRHLTDDCLCHLWRDVPKWKDYLATTVKTLKDLYDVAGSELDGKYLTSTHLQWHRGNSLLFEACRSKGQYRCQCNRLQQILPKATQGSAVGPGHLAENGAVIFGQSDSHVHEYFTTPRRATKSGLYSQPNISLLPQAEGDLDDDSSSSVFSEGEPSAQSGSEGTASSMTTLSTSSFQGVTDGMINLK